MDRRPRQIMSTLTAPLTIVFSTRPLEALQTLTLWILKGWLGCLQVEQGLPVEALRPLSCCLNRQSKCPKLSTKWSRRHSETRESISGSRVGIVKILQTLRTHKSRRLKFRCTGASWLSWLAKALVAIQRSQFQVTHLTIHTYAALIWTIRFLMEPSNNQLVASIQLN